MKEALKHVVVAGGGVAGMKLPEHSPRWDSG